MNKYYYKVDSKADTWEKVSIGIFQLAAERDAELVLVDPFKRIMQSIPLEEVKTLSEMDYNYSVFPALSPDPLTISDYELKLISRFHYSWYNALHSYLITNEFKAILNNSILERNSNTVFPKDPTAIFTQFLSDLNNIKAVWISTAPASAKDNGLCFSTFEKDKNPELTVLESAIKQEMELYPNWILQNDLLHLQNQGVHLMNVGLTSNSYDRFAYLNLWQPFTNKVIDILNQKENLTIICFGGVASRLNFDKKFKMFVVNHPRYFTDNFITVGEESFGCFKEFQELTNIIY